MLTAEELLMHLFKRKRNQLLIHQEIFQSAQIPKMMTKQSKELSQLLIHFQMLTAEE